MSVHVSWLHYSTYNTGVAVSTVLYVKEVKGHMNESVELHGKFESKKHFYGCVAP